MACISPCPTGSIDNWRQMPRVQGLQRGRPAAAGTSCRPNCDAQQIWLPKAWVQRPWPRRRQRLQPAPARGGDHRRSRRSTPPVLGATLPPWSAAHAYTNLYGPKAAKAVDHRHRRGNVRVTEVGQGVRHAPHRARLRRACPSRCSKASRSASCRRARCQRPRPPCAPVLDRQPAQRRAARLQQPLADHQARARRPPRQRRCAAWPATTCAT